MGFVNVREPNIRFQVYCRLKFGYIASTALGSSAAEGLCWIGWGCVRASVYIVENKSTKEQNKHSTLLEPQSRFGGKPLNFQVVYPQNGAAVLMG